jgi:hypothetical protein
MTHARRRSVGISSEVRGCMSGKFCNGIFEGMGEWCKMTHARRRSVGIISEVSLRVRCGIVEAMQVWWN